MNDLVTAARLAGWLLALALSVLVAGFIIDQLKTQIGTVARIPG